jgi:pimeloyl-ACP methyl ester carboxylesterase
LEEKVMELANLDGVEIEFDVRGSGETLMLVHGAILADALLPLIEEPLIADNYRVVSHHRRGFAGSARTAPSFTIDHWVSDCLALLRYLDIPRVHVAGHSYGAVISLQFVLSSPDKVISLALLEPPILNSNPASNEFMEKLTPLIETYKKGDKRVATDGFLTLVLGQGYRNVIDKVLPSGAFELAVSDIDNFYQAELNALGSWSFDEEKAKKIKPPVLSFVGTETTPIFYNSHKLIMKWVEHARQYVVPKATHGLQMWNPKAVAEGLSNFINSNQS